MGSGSFRKGIFKFGNGAVLQIAELPSDLWEGAENGGGLYPFQDSPIDLYLTSDNPADAGIPILLEGLNESGIIQQRLAVCNGYSPVQYSGKWMRQYRAINANHGQDIVGNIYISANDTYTNGVPDTVGTTKIIIRPEFQQTQMLVYTTPKDWRSEFCDITIGIVPKTTAVAWAKVGLFMRQPGKSWTNQGYIGLITSGTSVKTVQVGLKAGYVEPCTDIVVRAMELSANGIELAGNFRIDFKTEVKVDYC